MCSRRAGYDLGAHALAVAKRGDARALHDALMTGAPRNAKVATTAAAHGHLTCLATLYFLGHPIEADAARAAAGNGHLLCLRYLHERGCGWTQDTIRAAVEGGHVKCVEYAFYNGCEWPRDAIGRAATNGRAACFDFAHRITPLLPMMYSEHMSSHRDFLLHVHDKYAQGAARARMRVALTDELTQRLSRVKHKVLVACRAIHVALYLWECSVQRANAPGGPAHLAIVAEFATIFSTTLCP